MFNLGRLERIEDWCGICLIFQMRQRSSEVAIEFRVRKSLLTLSYWAKANNVVGSAAKTAGVSSRATASQANEVAFFSRDILFLAFNKL